MMTNLIQPKLVGVCQQIISVRGSVFYTDKRRRINLKKPVRDLISHIPANVAYHMEICMCPHSLKTRIESLTESNIRPILLYFEEECP